MTKMTLEVNDSQYQDQQNLLKDNDFVDSEGNPNSDVLLINQSDNESVSDLILKTKGKDVFENNDDLEKVKNINKVKGIIKNIEKTGRISQVSMESMIQNLPADLNVRFLPINCYSINPSKLHVDDTIRRLKASINDYSNEGFFGNLFGSKKSSQSNNKYSEPSLSQLSEAIDAFSRKTNKDYSLINGFIDLLSKTYFSVSWLKDKEYRESWITIPKEYEALGIDPAIRIVDNKYGKGNDDLERYPKKVEKLKKDNIKEINRFASEVLKIANQLENGAYKDLNKVKSLKNSFKWNQEPKLKDIKQTVFKEGPAKVKTLNEDDIVGNSHLFEDVFFSLSQEDFINDLGSLDIFSNNSPFLSESKNKDGTNYYIYEKGSSEYKEIVSYYNGKVPEEVSDLCENIVKYVKHYNDLFYEQCFIPSGTLLAKAIIYYIEHSFSKE